MATNRGAGGGGTAGAGPAPITSTSAMAAAGTPGVRVFHPARFPWLVPMSRLRTPPMILVRGRSPFRRDSGTAVRAFPYAASRPRRGTLLFRTGASSATAGERGAGLAAGRPANTEPLRFEA
ncbi:MAG: hypothetical protein QOK40_3645 [Miltoncostaeaceae bacterium]|nr:hypothetical protein [Miltoncostaeaceae bacterium]